ncbi:MAG: DUF3883 domain-containing protein [Bifidobacteriaceae bacterium]|jgi:hypothetical protein|nr:DUF3883 domain-containing protein [Bifidobacteriaceae bacterium]
MDLINGLFGTENVKEYADVIKLFLHDNYDIKVSFEKIKPIVRTRFKKLQQTGFEAEQYFILHFREIELFSKGVSTDARLYGDGYDFQIDVGENSFLTEIKGIRKEKGKFRLTENEYDKANEYKTDYFIVLVMNLESNPTFKTINNPLESLSFEKRIITPRQTKEYRLTSEIALL